MSMISEVKTSEAAGQVTLEGKTLVLTFLSWPFSYATKSEAPSKNFWLLEEISVYWYYIDLSLSIGIAFVMNYSLFQNEESDTKMV